MNQDKNLQPSLRAVFPLELFPTLGSLQEVLDLASSQLPLKYKNDVVALLFMYHNTLLLQQLKEQRNVHSNQPDEPATGISPGSIVQK